MQNKSRKEMHVIPLEFKNGVTRNVKVKASSRENAEKRALKFNPAAVGVKRGS